MSDIITVELAELVVAGNPTGAPSFSILSRLSLLCHDSNKGLRTTIIKMESVICWGTLVAVHAASSLQDAVRLRRESVVTCCHLASL